MLIYIYKSWSFLAARDRLAEGARGAQEERRGGHQLGHPIPAGTDPGDSTDHLIWLVVWWLGKPWENHGKTMGKPWENGDLYSNNDWLVVTGTID